MTDIQTMYSYAKCRLQIKLCRALVYLKIAVKSCKNFCTPIEKIRKENEPLEEELRQCDDMFVIKIFD